MIDRDDEYDEDDYLPDIAASEPPNVLHTVLALVAWSLMCAFVAGTAGLCVRLFRYAAWE